MHETSADDDDLWATLKLGLCPRCEAPKLVPAVPGWDNERYCLNCAELIGPDGQILED